MIQHYDPFGAKVWNVIRFAADEWGLYCAGRRNFFGTSLAARGTRAEIDRLVADRCLT